MTYYVLICCDFKVAIYVGKRNTHLYFGCSSCWWFLLGPLVTDRTPIFKLAVAFVKKNLVKVTAAILE